MGGGWAGSWVGEGVVVLVVLKWMVEGEEPLNGRKVCPWCWETDLDGSGRHQPTTSTGATHPDTRACSAVPRWCLERSAHRHSKSLCWTQHNYLQRNHNPPILPPHSCESPGLASRMAFVFLLRLQRDSVTALLLSPSFQVHLESNPPGLKHETSDINQDWSSRRMFYVRPSKTPLPPSFNMPLFRNLSTRRPPLLRQHYYPTTIPTWLARCHREAWKQGPLGTLKSDMKKATVVTGYTDGHTWTGRSAFLLR